MSLLATAKANGHEPEAWLTDVLTGLPTTLNRNVVALPPDGLYRRGTGAPGGFRL